jgi:hypothetical protein
MRKVLKLIKNPEQLRKIPDRNERLLAALLDGYERYLNNDDYEHLQRVKACFIMLTEGSSEIAVKRKMVKLGYTNAVRILEDVRYIFADVHKISPAFERVIQRERILKHIERATAAEDYKAVAQLEKTLAKITGTDNHVKQRVNWDMVNLPELQLTEDISVLEDKEMDDDFDDAEILD